MGTAEGTKHPRDGRLLPYKLSFLCLPLQQRLCIILLPYRCCQLAAGPPVWAPGVQRAQ